VDKASQNILSIRNIVIITYKQMAAPSKTNVSAVNNARKDNIQLYSEVGVVPTKADHESKTWLSNTTQSQKPHSSEDNDLINLRKKLADAEKKYADYFKIVSERVKNYFDRVNPQADSYLNTNLIFSNGDAAYVTNQGVSKLYPRGKLNTMKGKNGAPNQSTNIQQNDQNLYKLNSNLNTLTPHLKVGSPIQGNNNYQFGNEGKNIMVSKVLPEGISPPSYKGCYAVGKNSAYEQMQYIGDNGNLTTSMPSTKMYTYDACKTAAIYNGMQYFSVQDASAGTGWKGYCALSNNLVPFDANKNASYRVTGVKILWTSGLPKNVGNTAEFTNTGALMIKDSQGIIRFNTETGGNYVGCFLDNRGDSRNFKNGGNGKIYNYDTCKSLADERGYTYFGLQNETSNSSSGPNGTQAECWMGDDADYINLINNANFPQINSGNSRGGYYNCHLPSNQGDRSGKYYGGPSVNAVYSTDPVGTYYLMVKDSGSVSIYKGTHIPPTGTEYTDSRDKNIWNIGGVSIDVDPTYAAVSGKYASNCVVTKKSQPSIVLSRGDFIGSLTGKTYLKMENDGNLVLYTSIRVPNCDPDAKKNMVGGRGANAVYDVGMVGIPANLRKFGYVDENGTLHEYPSDMITYTKDSTYIGREGPPVTVNNSNFNTHKVSNTSTYKTFEQAQRACDTHKECNSILQVDNDYTLLKNKYGEPTVFGNLNQFTYFRSSKINAPKSCYQNYIGIDSLSWDRYSKNNGGMGKPMSSTFDCTFGQANMKDPHLEELKRNVDLLRAQIQDRSNNLVKRKHNAVPLINKSSSENKENAGTHVDIKNKKAHEKDTVAKKTLQDKIHRDIDKQNKKYTGKVAKVNTKPMGGQFSQPIWDATLLSGNSNDNSGSTPAYKGAPTIAPRKEPFTNMNSVITRIVNDSSIQVSQKNYEYALWLVLAILAIALCIRIQRIK